MEDETSECSKCGKICKTYDEAEKHWINEHGKFKNNDEKNGYFMCVSDLKDFLSYVENKGIKVRT